MKNLFRKNPFLILCLSIILFTSCKKDGTTDANAKSNITLHFDNIAGSVDLALNTGSYTNAVGENFTVTAFDYYISNIKLTKTDGTIYVVPQDSSYFLIKEFKFQNFLESQNFTNKVWDYFQLTPKFKSSITNGE